MQFISAKLDKRVSAILGALPRDYLLVSIDQQRLFHIRNSTLSALYPVSTSRFGTGNTENSFKTPMGLHRVVEKFGTGAPWGRIFKDRIDRGTAWHRGDPTGEDLILSRILWLEGLETGVNKGPGIDSHERYIYIHGTCNEERLGTPNSHGCVCMGNADVIELFSLVPEGTLVIID